jgi:class I fructose-bisphosphate aldolase
MDSRRIEELLGADAGRLLAHRCRHIPRESLHLPGPDIVDRVFAASDRPAPVLRSLAALYGTGRLAGTGYLSILPVDQGVLYGAGTSFAPNPEYFDPAAIARLALEAGCSAVTSTLGVLGALSRRFAHRIPFILKLNHEEGLTLPQRLDQVFFAQVEQGFRLGAVAVAATVYFGSDGSRRQIREVSRAFRRAHELGMATVLFCYLRNAAFLVDGVDHHLAADLTGQANHLGATIQADLLKQKLPEHDGGSRALPGWAGDPGSPLAGSHPIDLARYQVACGYMGRIGLISSGGPSAGDGDLAEAVRAAVINKRAGGSGLICGRKAFQRPLTDGVALLHAIQSVYLCDEVSVA